MKKTLAIFLAVAMLAGANVALAGNGHDDRGRGDADRGGHDDGEMGKHRGLLNRIFRPENRDDRPDKDEDWRESRRDWAENRFVIAGEVESVSDDSLVVQASESGKRKLWPDNIQSGEDVTVQVNDDTKIMLLGEDVELSEVEAGHRVMIVGQRDDETLTADSIRILASKKRVYGEITAKSDTAVTIENAVTGEDLTVEIDEDTKVLINGEVESTGEIEVGDRGLIKIRSVLNDAIAKVVKLFR